MCLTQFFVYRREKTESPNRHASWQCSSWYHNLKLGRGLKDGASERRADELVIARYYRRTGRYAMFFVWNHFWSWMHLGWDWRRNASRGQRHCWFLPTQQNANDTSADASGCSIPPVLSLHFCYQQRLGTGYGTSPYPCLCWTIHQDGIPGRWQFCWISATPCQECSVTVHCTVGLTGTRWP